MQMNKNIEKIIKEYIANSYGTSEAENPSYDIASLAAAIASGLSGGGYKDHVFSSCCVDDVRQSIDGDADEFPIICALTDDELDGYLERCAKKGKIIHNNDGGLDLYELESVISYWREK